MHSFPAKKRKSSSVESTTPQVKKNKAVYTTIDSSGNLFIKVSKSPSDLTKCELIDTNRTHQKNEQIRAATLSTKPREAIACSSSAFRTGAKTIKEPEDAKDKTDDNSNQEAEQNSENVEDDFGQGNGEDIESSGPPAPNPPTVARQGIRPEDLARGIEGAMAKQALRVQSLELELAPPNTKVCKATGPSRSGTPAINPLPHAPHHDPEGTVPDMMLTKTNPSSTFAVHTASIDKNKKTADMDMTRRKSDNSLQARTLRFAVAQVSAATGCSMPSIRAERKVVSASHCPLIAEKQRMIPRLTLPVWRQDPTKCEKFTHLA